MTSTLWPAIERNFQSAGAHFSRAAQIHAMGGFSQPGIDGYIASMSFLHAMQSGHTSLENGLLRTLALLGEDRPRGEHWHMDLLDQACHPADGRGPILPQDVCRHAHVTRGFRNVAVRSYEDFDPEQATSAVAAAKVLAGRLAECLHGFKLKIDPPRGGPLPNSPS